MQVSLPYSESMLSVVRHALENYYLFTFIFYLHHSRKLQTSFLQPPRFRFFNNGLR